MEHSGVRRPRSWQHRSKTRTGSIGTARIGMESALTDVELECRRAAKSWQMDPDPAEDVLPAEQFGPPYAVWPAGPPGGDIGGWC